MIVKNLKTILLTLILSCFVSTAEAQFVQKAKAFHIGTGNCSATAVTTAFSPAVALTAPGTNNIVLQITTNSTAGTVEITCPIAVPGIQLFTASKGIQITAVGFYYGVQTTALASIAPATLNTISYPVSTADHVSVPGV